MRTALFLIALALLTWTVAGQPLSEDSMFKLTSPAFAPSSTIPKKYTCDGRNVSPPLAWSGLPKGARSIAVIMEDPDAPAGLWIHWVLYDVPAGAGALAEGLPQKDSLPDGSKQGQSGGVIEFETIGYSGPCPPPGKPHRYVFRAYALKDDTLGLKPRAAKSTAVAAMEGKILGQAELTGLYGR